MVVRIPRGIAQQQHMGRPRRRPVFIGMLKKRPDRLRTGQAVAERIIHLIDPDHRSAKAIVLRPVFSDVVGGGCEQRMGDDDIISAKRGIGQISATVRQTAQGRPDCGGIEHHHSARRTIGQRKLHAEERIRRTHRCGQLNPGFTLPLQPVHLDRLQRRAHAADQRIAAAKSDLSAVHATQPLQSLAGAGGQCRRTIVRHCDQNKSGIFLTIEKSGHAVGLRIGAIGVKIFLLQHRAGKSVQRYHIMAAAAAEQLFAIAVKQRIVAVAQSGRAHLQLNAMKGGDVNGVDGPAGRKVPDGGAAAESGYKQGLMRCQIRAGKFIPAVCAAGLPRIAHLQPIKKNLRDRGGRVADQTDLHSVAGGFKAGSDDFEIRHDLLPIIEIKFAGRNLIDVNAHMMIRRMRIEGEAAQAQTKTHRVLLLVKMVEIEGQRERGVPVDDGPDPSLSGNLLGVLDIVAGISRVIGEVLLQMKQRGQMIHHLAG
ncbi:MAG: hypothetical protein BWY83_01931 [bacterium ADurb.Bin478]|nr:MAG: hypothetical protein BWY83_01931 [bacterium ADurb.Bin478]